MKSCRICSAPVRLYLTKHGYEIFRCTACGFGQINVTAHDIEDFYDQSYFQGEKAHFQQGLETEPHPALPFWLEHNLDRVCPSNGVQVLEIGPGLGGPLAGYMRKTHPEMDYAAIEISGYAAENLRRRGFRVFEGRVTHPATIESCFERYDLIFGTEVIEHDPEPHPFAQAVYKMLKPGGCAAFTTVNIDGWMARWSGQKWYYLDPPAHVSYYTPSAVKILFGAEGFSTIQVRRYGLSYINLKLKTHLPGILLATHLSNISTGMSILARRGQQEN